MRIAIIDVITCIVIAVVILATVSLYYAVHGPDSVVREVTVHEIAPGAPANSGI
jgi:hypothetical protein